MNAAKRKFAGKILARLRRAYPDAQCALHHDNPLQLLVATILSAQCTDERVNKVTADLFRKYRKPEDYLKVPATELQEDIRQAYSMGANSYLVKPLGFEALVQLVRNITSVWLAPRPKRLPIISPGHRGGVQWYVAGDQTLGE